MPISAAMEILLALQNQYGEFAEDEAYGYGDKNLSARLSLRILSKKFTLTPKAIGVFLKRVGAWLPKYRTYSSGAWEKDLKTEKSKIYYQRIFELLHDEYDISPRPLNEIIYLLIFQAGLSKWHIYSNRMQNFLDKLRDSYEFDFYASANALKVLLNWWDPFLIKLS